MWWYPDKSLQPILKKLSKAPRNSREMHSFELEWLKSLNLRRVVYPSYSEFVKVKTKFSNEEPFSKINLCATTTKYLG